jgi:hypothetical protein
MSRLDRMESQRRSNPFESGRRWLIGILRRHDFVRRGNSHWWRNGVRWSRRSERRWFIDRRRLWRVISQGRSYCRFAWLQIFHLPLQLAILFFLRAGDRFLALLHLLGDVMTIGALASSLRAHRTATGEIKENGGCQQQEQGFVVHGDF